MSPPPVIDVLVPVKALQSSKGRLRGLLSTDERAALVRAMLADLLAAVQDSGCFRRCWVVSRDAEVLALAASFRARALAEPEDAGGLNPALEWARAEVLKVHPPSALLIVPTDLPGATDLDLTEFVAGLDQRAERALVRLCPSPDGGTNALLLRPCGVIRFAYGRGSAARHEGLAREAGALFERREPAGLRVDVDGPDDLRERIREPDLVQGERTRAVLAQLRL